METNIILFTWLLSWWIILLIFKSQALKNIQKKSLLQASKEDRFCILPENVPPALVASLFNKDFDHLYLSAEIVQMAILGHAVIKRDDASLWKCLIDLYGNDKYSLIRTMDKSSIAKIENPYYASLLNTIFDSNVSDTVHINKSFLSSLPNALETLNQQIKKETQEFFISTQSIDSNCLKISFIALLPLYFYLSIFASLFITLVFCTSWSFRNTLIYSFKGREFHSSVQGLNQYLSKKEFIHLPMAKKKALYEYFFPYALALRMQDSWNKRFDNSFRKDYNPLWYQDSSKKFTDNDVWFDFISPFDWKIYQAACRIQSKHRSTHRCKNLSIT